MNDGDESVQELRQMDRTGAEEVSHLPSALVTAREALKESMRDCIDAAIVATNSVNSGVPVSDQILIASVAAAGKRFIAALDLHLQSVYDAGKHSAA